MSMAAVVVIVLSALGIWTLTRSELSDCGEFAFDRTAWERSSAGPYLEEESSAEKERRRLARGLVECRLLDRLTKKRVRRLLGSPDSSEVSPNPVPHRGWSYQVGIDRDWFDPGEEQSLYIQFAKDQRARYVEVPVSSSGEVSRSGRAVGEPRVTLPRVVGLTRSEATRVLARANLRWRYRGPRGASSATVQGQWPSPGKKVLQEFRIPLEMERRCDRDPDLPSGFWPRRGRCRHGAAPRDY